MDVLVFTAGVGENSVVLRQRVCGNLTFFGVEIDEEENKKRGGERRISAPSSKVEVLVVPTNEEYMVARDTYAIITQAS